MTFFLRGSSLIAYGFLRFCHLQKKSHMRFTFLEVHPYTTHFFPSPETFPGILFQFFFSFSSPHFVSSFFQVALSMSYIYTIHLGIVPNFGSCIVLAWHPVQVTCIVLAWCLVQGGCMIHGMVSGLLHGLLHGIILGMVSSPGRLHGTWHNVWHDVWLVTWHNVWSREVA
jgi:hypothetical protein